MMKEQLTPEQGDEWDKLVDQGVGNGLQAYREVTGNPASEKSANASGNDTQAARNSTRPKPTRRGLGSRQLLNADEPPPGVDDARKTY